MITTNQPSTQHRTSYEYLYKIDQIMKLQNCREIENLDKRGRSLLVVVATPPSGNYDEFSEKVREYDTKPPFNFAIPPLFNNSSSKVNFFSLLFNRVFYFSLSLFAHIQRALWLHSKSTIYRWMDTFHNCKTVHFIDLRYEVKEFVRKAFMKFQYCIVFRFVLFFFFLLMKNHLLSMP